MPDATEAARTIPAPPPPANTGQPPSRTIGGWLFPTIRVLGVIAAGFLAWYIAGHWNR